MEKTAAEKMGVKEHSRAFIQADDCDAVRAIQLPPLDLSLELNRQFDYMHLFAKNQEEFNRFFYGIQESFESRWDALGILAEKWKTRNRLKSTTGY